jgi:lipoprotein NlpD
VRGPILARFSANDATRTGIKIGGHLGEAVHATEAGKVVYSGSGLIGYGQLIIIKHNDHYLSAYGHNAKLLVKEGDKVARGKHIADMGRSNDGKAMLHFEIRREGKPVNPLALLPK